MLMEMRVQVERSAQRPTHHTLIAVCAAAVVVIMKLTQL